MRDPSETSLENDLFALFEEPTGVFDQLVLAANLDPAEDFKDRDLRDVSFREADLTGFDFSGSDLRGTMLRLASCIDTTTCLDRAELDEDDEEWNRRRITDTAPFSPLDLERIFSRPRGSNGEIFVGRGELLAQLHADVASRRSPILLSGPRGIGKTSIARRLFDNLSLPDSRRPVGDPASLHERILPLLFRCRPEMTSVGDIIDEIVRGVAEMPNLTVNDRHQPGLVAHWRVSRPAVDNAEPRHQTVRRMIAAFNDFMSDKLEGSRLLVIIDDLEPVLRIWNSDVALTEFLALVQDLDSIQLLILTYASSVIEAISLQDSNNGNASIREVSPLSALDVAEIFSRISSLSEGRVAFDKNLIDRTVMYSQGVPGIVCEIVYEILTAAIHRDGHRRLKIMPNESDFQYAIEIIDQRRVVEDRVEAPEHGG